MKITLAILTSVLILCGCAHRPTSLSHRAIDLIQPGEEVAWSNGIFLTVAKRDGDSVEDVRIVSKGSDGQEATFTAKTGTLLLGSVENPEDENCVRLMLREARGEKSKESFAAGEMMIVLKK